MKNATKVNEITVEALWKIVQPLGWSRQEFETLLSNSGPTALLAACPSFVSPPAEDATREEALWVKDTSPYHVFTDYPVLEPLLEKQTTFITPNDLFFVCNEISTARIDISTYRLKVEGDAIERPLELTYDDLLSLPSRTVLVYLECAGNQRRLFEKVLDQPAEDVQWMLGGVSMASWTGVPLRLILEMAGVKSNGLYVNVKGLDENAPEGGVSRPMPIEKAMDPDTILAYIMNGEILPPDHGFPLRAIVPGWVGTNSVKWAGTITASSEKIWVDRNTEHYVLKGPEWPAEEYAPAQGAPITTQNIKSSLALPWPATLPNGPQLLRGFARSPHAKIAKVEWSADGGQNWQMATLLEPNLKYAWVRFELNWDAPTGTHSLMTRATDELGNTQPDTIPFNKLGYMFNMVHPHPVTVL